MKTKSWAFAVCLMLGSAGLAAPVSTTADAADTAEKPADAIDATILHVQVILDHLGFSPGVLDGKPGQSFTSALEGFQESRGFEKTGKLDRVTIQALRQYREMRAVRRLRLTADGLAGPFVNPMPEDPAEKAKLPALGYRNVMEKLAEMFHTTPEVLIALNSPATRLVPGNVVVFPNALPGSRDYDPKLPEEWRRTLSMLNVDAVQKSGARIVVDKSDGVLRVFDTGNRLIAQFPATMGSEHDPLPIGRWTVQGVAYNPPFHYNPDLFWDAKKGEDELLLPPGPNGPVGVVWIDLSKPHYGIHGTPAPETIGRAESHGCIRLSNWDAARLAMMIAPGTPAIFQN